MPRLRKLLQLGKDEIGCCAVPKLEVHPRKVIDLKYEFDTEEQDFVNGYVRFSGVHAYRWTNFYFCSLAMLDAYDAVVEVEDSLWLKELFATAKESDFDESELLHYMLNKDRVDLHHYIVFFDDEGCYEFVAEGFEIHEGEDLKVSGRPTSTL